MNILLDLFLTFAKIGLFTFGGGYAMIAMIENNCVERKQWITGVRFWGLNSSVGFAATSSINRGGLNRYVLL